MKSFAVKVIVISEESFRMEILTSFRKEIVISQGIPLKWIIRNGSSYILEGLVEFKICLNYRL